MTGLGDGPDTASSYRSATPMCKPGGQPILRLGRWVMELTERVQTALQASVVFLDIVGYSRRAVAEQYQVKKQFNTDIAYALASVAQEGRLML